MTRYISYIKETLHVNAEASIYARTEALPLYLRNGYDIYTLAIQNIQCLLVRPKEPMNLTVFRKQCGQLKKATAFDCVLCLEKARIYTKEKMLSEGIPFIILGQQIYMPFLGVALTQHGMREIPYTEQMSFVTQKFLLTAIYQGWKQVTLTEASKFLGVSKMTVTRCYDELESLELPLVKSEGKIRRFFWDDDCRSLWNVVRPFLRNPVKVQYRIGERIDIGSAKLAGMSAVCHYSTLADNTYPVYALTHEAFKRVKMNTRILTPENESPEMIVQIMRYDLEYFDAVAIDPLTAILSLTDEELSDSRVEAAVEEMLKVYLSS